MTVIFLGQFCPRGKGAMRLSLCEAPTRETRPGHNTEPDGPLGSYANFTLPIPVNNAITILPTIFLTNLAENDEFVPCAGEINMNCYTAGVTDWKGHSSFFPYTP